MGGSSGLSWSEQWGAHNNNSNDGTTPFTEKQQQPKAGGNKKMQDVKAAASVGFEKAKVAASVGAEKAKVGAKKVKAGTVTGIKWLKDQYSKTKTKK